MKERTLSPLSTVLKEVTEEEVDCFINNPSGIQFELNL